MYGPTNRALAAALTAMSLGCAEPGGEAGEVAARAREIHAAVLKVDAHVDIPLDFATAAVDPLDADLQVNLEKMRAGGLDAAFFIVYVEQTERTPGNETAAKQAAMTKFEAIHRMTEELHPDRIGLARKPDDVLRIRDDGRLVAAIGVENGWSIGTDLPLLERYHELGARYMTLTHNGHNDLADSAVPRPELGDAEEEHGGLSALGEEVVREMNRIGMMVDLSHLSKAAALDAIRVSAAPVIASHSSVRALADHPRNLDDETLLALRDGGGVVLIVAVDSFLVAPPPERAEALAELREAVGYEGSTEGMSHEQKIQYDRGLEDLDIRFPPASVVELVDHVEYAVDLIGIEHVGISSDFDGGGGIRRWRDASESPAVTEELVRRGYDAEQIAMIWGGNLLRVWREVERMAAAGR